MMTIMLNSAAPSSDSSEPYEGPATGVAGTPDEAAVLAGDVQDAFHAQEVAASGGDELGDAAGVESFAQRRLVEMAADEHELVQS